ncbi:hypothetical protein GLOIN_2v1766803 [Rhizophagus irregularis DAOM 181602=DAOM 197198]|uniref:Uncharacterized protein n=1 Tax=Rhizophagus irregularis (strain DAOM 181602 / DAOM 197198 / MUCL 43194) TaxID=747089 RepID=A0A2P4QL29_RHIID|nr:hypothetical protein GLOIN_2v1766803 [Rhizophagus irregularis DAOM 181602=DAOM 197198]POG78341.1 hypothetical protein GLOIN_2v1766803 [Rhizophagus irregularis DAOM 181602=DAOM 197198]|eukprot:XP_025185207.1 hypothetical protein GLOIN_2v1766803 [Rhizophagus irregularis DAOM 181602=DAOM 197198]
MVNIQLIELNLKGTQILNSDSRPRNDKKRKRLKERRYQYVSEMTKDLREALRRDLFWNLARMPQETQLDIEKTFESQKDLVVKTIVPNLMKILDLDTYLIGEGDFVAKFWISSSVLTFPNNTSISFDIVSHIKATPYKAKFNIDIILLAGFVQFWWGAVQRTINMSKFPQRNKQIKEIWTDP